MTSTDNPTDLDALTERIVSFLRSIGLPVSTRALPEPTFLPGITVDRGTLVYDPQRLAHPGDLLHEAGHLAVLPPAQRQTMVDDVGNDGGMEMGAIAWSYAALTQLGLPLEVLFHDHGYKGDGAHLRETFATGGSLGVPILEWRGLTDWQRPGSEQSATRYPVMKQWLCGDGAASLRSGVSVVLPSFTVHHG